MRALIDGDIVLYRCGYASEKDGEDIALVRTDTMLREILNETGSDEYEIWLSDNSSNNFRYSIDPEYKANRVQPRPIHYEAIKDFLFREWNAQLALGEEADDALGIQQTKHNLWEEENPKLNHNISIIASIDKDLLQIPGRHYNFVKKEFQTVEYLEGVKHFYKQLLIGDTSDNVKGVDKIGKVKAGRLIDPLTTEQHMFDVVRHCYNDDRRLLKNGKLLYIRRREEEIWEFPKEVHTSLEPEARSSYTPTVPREIALSTERTTQAMAGCLAPGCSMEGSIPNTQLQLTF